jgi:hypothetical protein
MVTQPAVPVAGIRHQDLMTISEAERILGESAMLADSTTTMKNDVLTYNCSFKAVSMDSVSGKTGNIYFMFEDYNRPEAAHKVYENIRIANETHEGLTKLDDMGDEAYFHTDHQNFYFILARKGTRMLRMKVNKTTIHTSLDEFNRVAKEITLKL